MELKVIEAETPQRLCKEVNAFILDEGIEDDVRTIQVIEKNGMFYAFITVF